MILLIKSETKDVELHVYENAAELASKKWDAGRELSEQLLAGIDDILASKNTNIASVKGLVVYEGPGSYTGLRISISVANSIGYSNKVPVVGVTGENWISDGLKKIDRVSDFTPISPVYGGEVFTTKPKK